MATYAQGYDETRKELFSLSDPDINFARVDTGFHFYFSEGKHADMNNGHQQQPGNGCNHQGPNQSHKSQHVDGAETQALPMPIPDPPIQYTKVSYTQQRRVKAMSCESSLNVRNDSQLSSRLAQISLFLELAHNSKAWGIQNST